MPLSVASQFTPSASKYVTVNTASVVSEAGNVADGEIIGAPSQVSVTFTDAPLSSSKSFLTVIVALVGRLVTVHWIVSPWPTPPPFWHCVVTM